MPDPRNECFHCGLPVPHASDYTVEIDGRMRPMCCPGCAAVAQTIVAGGFDGYYRHRTANAPRRDDVVPELLSDPEAYDQPQLHRSFVSECGDGCKRASLILGGITCAACVWLIERRLRSLAGVRSAEVNYATGRAHIVFDPERGRLSSVLKAIQDIGYYAHPYDPRQQEARAQSERRRHIQRIGVAGALGMQIMMIATALYFGEWTGISSAHREFLQWVSLLLALPIVLYSAQPFYMGAWRHVRHRNLGMDVPVALGLSVAFLGSAWATWQQQGAVYYESVAMFVFLLLTARFFEFTARSRSAATVEMLTRRAPDRAQRVGGDGRTQWVLAEELSPGDRVIVPAGVTVPADGVVLHGAASIDESLLTGESRPIAKAVGDDIIGGSVNLGDPVTMQVTRGRGETLLDQIAELIARAQAQKPVMVQIADRAAAWFVAGVLVLAAASGWYWVQHEPDRWLPILISVLVVTCPCALSLATPAAMTVAIGALSRLGMIPVRADALAALPAIDYVVMDKTGTLTEGKLRLEETLVHARLDAGAARAVANALEQHASHPIARALRHTGGGGAPATDVSHEADGGISGTVDGRRYHLGSAAYVCAQGVDTGPLAANARRDATVAHLADPEGLVATFVFADRLRADAPEFLAALRNQGIRTAVYSGDTAQALQRLTEFVEIDERHALLSPQDKLTLIRLLQNRGHRVLMIGDGINDAPVLAAADVSVAMGGGADLARAHADLILLNNRLTLIPLALRTARCTRRVIFQNIAWAIGYNLLALPAAATGMVPPWAAAIGMSASSLIVVANALRIDRQASPAVDDPHPPASAVAYA